MNVPPIRYADVGGRAVAFQIFGEGVRDLLIVPGVVSHLELSWSDPGFAHLMRRLGSFSRVITYDRLGVGLSDSVSDLPTLDDRVAEIGAVLDAAESRKAHVLGYSEGGAFAGYFAASQPGRVESIFFVAPWVRGPRDDPAEGVRPEAIEKLARCIDRWGEGLLVEVMAPSLANKPMQRRLYASAERLIAGPGYARAILQGARQMDVSSILPHIRVPSLVIGVTEDSIVPIEHVRAIAAAIPGAQLFELDGHDHLVWAGDATPALDAIERFVTGDIAPRDVDRMLATVVFTDIVGSTQRLAEVGDRGWRNLVEEHDNRVRRVIDAHGGSEVKTLGDGFLMTFAAPHSALAALKEIQLSIADLGLEIRAGIHTGDVEIAGADLAGMTVNTAARISALAGPGEIVVSRTVRELLGPTGTICAEYGTHELKGVPGRHPLYLAAEPSRISIGADERRVRIRDRMTLVFAKRVPGLARSMNARLQARAAPAA